MTESTADQERAVAAAGGGPDGAADTDVAPGADGHRGRFAGLVLLSGALAVALVALVIFALVALHRGRDADARQAAGRAAAAATAVDIPKLASYSYSTIDADKKRALSVLSPALRSKYNQIFGTLGETLQQRKVSVTAKTDQAQALDVVSTTQVRVLVFFDQTTSTPTAASPGLTVNSYAVTMQKFGSTWLIASVDATPTTY